MCEFPDTEGPRERWMEGEEASTTIQHMRREERERGRGRDEGLEVMILQG